MAEQLPPDAKSPVLLTRTPGVSSWTTVGNGPIYGTHSALGFLFVVTGNRLYGIDSSKTKTLLGSLSGDPSECDIDSNVDTVVVVSPPYAYYYDGMTFAQITDADF